MAQIDLSKVHSKVKYTQFGGVDRKSPFSLQKDKMSFYDSENFRINAGGFAEKRNGFEFMLDLYDTPSAIFKAGENELLAICSDKLLSVNLNTKVISEKFTFVKIPQNPCFFSYDNNVCLISGENMYIYENDTLKELSGYVPLYGKDWNCTYMGKVNEPFNMLSDHIRISYRIDKDAPYAPSQFYLPFAVESVDAVFENGEMKFLPHYPLTENKNAILNQHTYDANSKIEFYLTVSKSYTEKSELCKCSKACFFGDRSKGLSLSNIAFYLGNDKKSVCISTPCQNTEFEKCKAIYNDIYNIYVKAGEKLSFDSDVSVCLRKDKGLMIFTKGSAMFLEICENGEKMLSPVSSSKGCLSENGAFLLGNTLITVSSGGIFAWVPKETDSYEYYANCISSSVNELLSESFFKNAVITYCMNENELWFRDPYDKTGRVFIYSLPLKCFYIFKGINAEKFFDNSGNIGFTDGKKIFCFSRDLSTDDGKPIPAFFESNIIYLSDDNDLKKLCGCILRTSKNSVLKLTVSDAKKRKFIYNLSDKSGEKIGHIEKRILCPRSRYYSISLETLSENKTVIYGITVCAVD